MHVVGGGGVGGGDDVDALRGGELHRGLADAAGGAVDEQGLARADARALHEVVGGGPGGDQGGGEFEARSERRRESLSALVIANSA